MNLFVCAEAGITFTAHIVRFHPPFCCDPYCCNPPWQLKAVRGWFSVYRSQNVCQTFLTLHHSLGELHQPHSIFRLWENPMTHAPLMTSPSVNLTAPLPNQAFPWPGWSRHLVVTGCLCHKGSRTFHKASRTKKPYQQSLNMLKGLASPVTCQKRVAWLRLSLVRLAWLHLHLTSASLQNTACHLALKAWLGFILSQLGMLKSYCSVEGY